MALAVSALAKNNHNNNNAKANATDALVAASVKFLPSPYQKHDSTNILAQGVNAAANNGANGDAAAAIAQEAADEFEAGQAVTAVGPLITHSIFFSINEDKANG